MKKIIAVFLAIYALSACQSAEKKPSDAKVKEDYLDVIQTHVPDVKDCYEQHFKNKHNRDVTLEVAWCVKPDGNITELKAKQNLKNQDLQKCVLDKFQGFQFPPSKDDTTHCASYNYVFLNK